MNRDPAVEAAQRVCPGTDSPTALTIYRIAEAAAREALAPIRAKHYPVAYINRKRCCVSCFDPAGKPKLWPCSIALDTYSSEELER